MKISVVINTLNAEKYLRQVLESVKELDEILVCDMHSEDSTIQIAEEFNCKIVSHERTGFVEPARNFAISQAKNDWVLLLDADEVVNDDLKSFLVKKVQENNNIVCFAIPRKNYFLNKFMHSAYPDYVYRFFRKEKIVWPEFIHSVPEINGEIFRINKKDQNLAIEHLANDCISTIAAKSITYSSAEIPKRKHKKVSMFKLMFSPYFYFIKFYFLKQGFRDGKEGFIFAKLKAQYKFMTLAKVYEFQQKK